MGLYIINIIVHTLPTRYQYILSSYRVNEHKNKSV